MVLLPVIIAASASAQPALRVLDNGATLVHQRIIGARSFSFQVFVRTGSAEETAANAGINHLLEHSAFLGDADARAEAKGCHLNATTFREVVRYSCDGPAVAWKSAPNLVVDLLSHPVGPLENELRVLELELEHERSRPEMRMSESLWLNAFPEYGRHPAGDIEAMRRLSKAEVEALRTQRHVGANIVAVLVGDMDGGQAFAEMSAALSRLAKGAKKTMPQPDKIRPTRIKQEGTPALVGFGFFAPGLDRLEDFVALEVALAVLSNRAGAPEVALGASSRGSLCTILFEGAEAQALQQMRDFQNGLTHAEFESAKRIVSSKYKRALLSPTDSAFLLGVHVLFTGNPLIDEILTTISQLEARSANAIAASLGPERAVTVVWSP